MKGMIRTLERFGARKKLEVNVGKTKIMRCRKGGGRKRKVRWNWEGEWRSRKTGMERRSRKTCEREGSEGREVIGIDLRAR